MNYLVILISYFLPSFCTTSKFTSENPIECSFNDDDFYICSSKPEIVYKKIKCPTKKKISIEVEGNKLYPQCMPLYPQCGPFYPQCGPFYPRMQPICPQPLPQPPAPKINIFDYLTRLLVKTQQDLTNYINTRSKEFNETVLVGFTAINMDLGTKISAANNSLISTIDSLFAGEERALLQKIQSQIATTNQAVLSGLNSLINTANIAVKTNITTLGTLSDTAIETSIKDLTTTAGTLQQLLAITKNVSTGTASLLAQKTAQELTAINTLFASSNSTLQPKVTSAVNSTNKTIQGLIATASGQAGTLMINSYNKYYTDVSSFLDTLLSDYNKNINRAVIAYFS